MKLVMNTLKIDPFSIKEMSKWHPRRLAFTAKARAIDWEAKRNYKKYVLPAKELESLPDFPLDVDWKDTDVTPYQMQHIMHAVNLTESKHDSVILEVGCYRGVTTSLMARHTSRKVIAVDPYIGYGGSEEDFSCFKKNTKKLSNVIHERTTSGKAFSHWNYGPISLVFIDAVHDYVNTAFDIEAWSSLLVDDGIIAMHDTDQYRFAGTRKAVFEANRMNSLFAHPDNLTIFQKRR